MKPLTPEQVDWIALSLVNTGEVTKHHQTYFNSGYPLPAWLLPLFDALVVDGLLALTPSNDKGLARVLLTDTGRVRYAQRAMCIRGTPCLPPVLTDRSAPSAAEHAKKWPGADPPSRGVSGDQGQVIRLLSGESA